MNWKWPMLIEPHNRMREVQVEPIQKVSTYPKHYSWTSFSKCTCMCFLVGAGAGTSGGVFSQCSRIHQGQGKLAQNIIHEHWRERGVENEIRIDLCASFSLFLSFLLSLSCKNMFLLEKKNFSRTLMSTWKTEDGVPKLKKGHLEIVLMDSDFFCKSFILRQMWQLERNVLMMMCFSAAAPEHLLLASNFRSLYSIQSVLMHIIWFPTAKCTAQPRHLRNRWLKYKVFII